MIRRVLLRFKLDPGTYVTITPNASVRTHLPLDEPVPVPTPLTSAWLDR